MTVTTKILDEFRAFAAARISAGSAAVNMVELAAECEFRHASPEALADDLKAVEAALRDMDAGETGRPIKDFAADFSSRHRRSTDS
ncbi:MAG: hypothetical protein KDA96_24865 [Planctomycetaceae bacterium]|nr:hypothetical protein [Planctomycetaceae bacterium]